MYSQRSAVLANAGASMTCSNVLPRLAFLPLAFVTVLGACGGYGIGEPLDSDPVRAVGPGQTSAFVPGPQQQIFDVDIVARQLSVPIRIEKTFDRRLFDTPSPVPLIDFIDNQVVDVGPCLDSEAKCDGACVKLIVDDLNCGACGNTCGDAEHCEAGACTAGCDD